MPDKCSTRKKISKTEKDVGKTRFRNPFYRCTICGAPNYDEGILEPALLSKERKKSRL